MRCHQFRAFGCRSLPLVGKATVLLLLLLLLLHKKKHKNKRSVFLVVPITSTMALSTHADVLSACLKVFPGGRSPNYREADCKDRKGRRKPAQPSVLSLVAQQQKHSGKKAGVVERETDCESRRPRLLLLLDAAARCRR
jgi:hypothetical protein